VRYLLSANASRYRRVRSRNVGNTWTN
jgi:hypothetical protein